MVQGQVSLADRMACACQIFKQPSCPHLVPAILNASHLNPQELIPEKRFLFFPELPTVSGSIPLSRRVQGLQPDLHVFGHSHFAWDATIRGTRFVQAPLCTARERSRRLASIKVGLERTPDDAQPSEWLPVPLYQLPLAQSRDACERGVGGLWMACVWGEKAG